MPSQNVYRADVPRFYGASMLDGHWIEHDRLMMQMAFDGPAAHEFRSCRFKSSLAGENLMTTFRPPPGLGHPTVDSEGLAGSEHPLESFRSSKDSADADVNDTDDPSAGSDIGHETRTEDSIRDWSPRECLSNPSELQQSNKTKPNVDADAVEPPISAPNSGVQQSNTTKFRLHGHAFQPPIAAPMAHRGRADLKLASLKRAWEVQGHKLVSGLQGEWDVWCSACEVHAKVAPRKLIQPCLGCPKWQ
jgi:hypothetical protein